MKNRFVVVDLETTGNIPKKDDKIIQFAAVVIEDGEIVERFASFVNPNRDIPQFIEQLTGISNDVVANAPEFSIIAPEIISLFEDSYFVAHNVPFDLSFLQIEFENCGYEFFDCLTIDTVELSRIMLPWADSYKLGQLAESFSLVHDNPHQADSDAEVTAEILLKIFAKLNKLPLVTLRKLLSLSKHLKSDLYEILEEIITKRSEFLDEEKEYDVYRGLALKKCTVEKDSFISDLENVKLSNILEDVSLRQGQLEMLTFILNAMETNQHALVEAGTGIGKTLAYLLPSIYFAKINERVVISTHTIQLQQQLLERDIPKIKEIFPFPINIALLKGIGHYLSLRKFEQVLYEESDNYDENLSKAQILIWLTETETGDIDEIHLPSGGKILWEKVKCNRTENTIRDCPWESRCFYKRARKQAEKADIIITNHALLYSNIMNNHAYLPSYQYIIVDEAHHLEPIGRKYLGQKVNYIQFHSIITQIGILDSHGLLMQSKKIFTNVGLDDSSFQLIDILIKELKINISDLFRSIHNMVIKNNKQNDNTYRIQYLLDSSKESGGIWQEILELQSRIKIHFKEIIVSVRLQQDVFSNYDSMTTPLHKGIVHDYFASYEELGAAIIELEKFLLDNQKKYISWIELDPKGPLNSANLYREPIEIADRLADTFYQNKKSVILTSATLTIDNTFEYVIEKNGLTDFQPLTLLLKSTFDYKNQAKIMIPNDMPVINSVPIDEYVHSLALQIAEIAIRTNGRMLVLFTSYEMLKSTYEILKKILILDNFILIAQGISGGSRTKLTKNFQAFDKAILLGTNSFWEGVDIPGDDLSALIMVRLPFAPPNDPVFSTRAKMITEAGGDPFHELSLPEAVIRFKQGVGRLIRSENDKGILFIMDRRITTTSYGKKFLSSLPTMTIFEQPLQSLLQEIDNWL
ncbi:ATP-dependent DNA helicase DinG [Fredinandcohnia quinoae]|uniref:3'-5' exonuclease DinG n=1 Tax=Fredinandcohnia quinoae TaxID=2918902 RepID=A0AAW5E5Q2_9BACI|nr:ATP-dependent DNA helicase DinG [Fredinandcohnia sp. SECRCQ15]MCH1624716.1 ATP-dependent DNA helicase DinG [Fredinandcohnia sp. SECRCQ15]